MSKREFKYVGKQIQIREDHKFLNGKGVYINDITLPSMLHVALVLSPYAHAKIKRIMTENALKIPGVVGVWTGKDLINMHKAPLPVNVPSVPSPHVYILAVDKVRHVGEPVAAVVAEDPQTAREAAEAVEVEYEVLPAVVDAEKALEPGAPKVHDQLESNLFYHDTFKYGDVDKAFADADVIYKERFVFGRVTGQPLETEGAIASYDKSTGEMVVWSNWQNPTYLEAFAAATLGIPLNKFHHISVDIGGSYGVKYTVLYPVVLTGMLSMLTGRPVKYVESRYEHIASWFASDVPRVYYVEAAATKEGIILGIKEKIISDYGAYLGVYSPGQEFNPFSQWVGAYKIKNVYIDINCVFTNTTPTGAVRGFGAPQQAFVIERIVDGLAERLGLDRVEIRKRNFIRPDEFPYTIPTGNIYDSGNYHAVLERALKLSNYEELKKEQERLRTEGKYIGIGLATVPHRSSYNVIEMVLPNPSTILSTSAASARIRIDPGGYVSVTLYFPQSGQAHLTDVAQMVAEMLSVNLEHVSVTLEEDTRKSSGEAGPGGSRITPMLDMVIAEAVRKLKEKMLRIASRVLSWDIRQLTFDGDKIVAQNNPEKKISISDLAFIAYWQSHLIPDEEPGLEAYASLNSPFSPPDKNRRFYFYPFMGFSTHIPVVEVDPETGLVKVLRFFIVEDSGTIINPLSAKGQVIGGAMMGIGTSLTEEVLYDENGNLLTDGFRHYHMPTTIDTPEFIVEFVETPSTLNYFGSKGVGEAGRIAAPAAIASAVEDALKPFGVKIKEVPITPEKLLNLLKRHGGS